MIGGVVMIENRRRSTRAPLVWMMFTSRLTVPILPRRRIVELMTRSSEGQKLLRL